MNSKKITFRIFVWIMTVVIGLIILFPVYWIFLSSITPKSMLFTRPIHYIPLAPTIQNYFSLFKTVDIVNLAKNTLVITLFSMLISLLLSVFAAYSLARYKFAGSGVVYGFLISSAMLPMISTVIPMFQFFKSLKLIDTYPGLILLYSSGFIPFTVLIFVNFIKQTPRSIEEAAEVDGAGTLQKIFLVLLPVLKPAMATMAIINFISCMNEFMIPLIFATNKVMTLSVGITMIPRVNQYNVPWEKISALGTLMLIPIVLFVVIFEKNIMEGLMTGSVKQ